MYKDMCIAMHISIHIDICLVMRLACMLVAHGRDFSRFLSGRLDKPNFYMHAFYAQSQSFGQVSGVSGLPEDGVSLSQTWGCGCVYSGYTSNLQCMQFRVLKPSAPSHKHSELLS